MNEATEPNWPARTAAGRARAAALAGFEPPAEPAEWVEYQSQGRVLIIGPADEAWPLAAALREQLDCFMLATRPPTESPESAPPARYLDGRPRGLSGYLGNFTLEIEVERGRVLPAAAAFGSDRDSFDLVLDLDGSGNIRVDVPPPGYLLATDAQARQSALEELPGLIGEFQKPRYFAYDADICAHGARGLSGCSNCLNACATGAILSIGETIEVNPYLCQGCGSCVTQCPSGALAYQAPTAADLLDAARALLRDYREQAAREDQPVTAPSLLLYSAETAADTVRRNAPDWPENLLPLPVEDIGAVGLDSWLSMLAYGAARVLLLPGPTPAPSLVQASQSMLRVVRPILAGLGDAEADTRVVWLDSAADAGNLPEVAPMVDQPATFGALGGKRELIRRALEVLHGQADDAQATVALPDHAPFGTLDVDADKCTLCMACVSVCPASAVQGGGEHPRLDFREDHCLQCGLCEQACPEDAIDLVARMNFSAHIEPEKRVLNQAELHHCPECGKAFGTRQLMDRMLERLTGHWMFGDEQARRRLLCCEDCRIQKLWDEQGTLDPKKPDPGQ
ncbi:MAG: 4Fe-4S binding protein [Wenzhouxiangellaceae bacterium]|nr:4Fe-4S binding protein [Wenzhouxiangellaceae bacterium]